MEKASELVEKALARGSAARLRPALITALCVQARVYMEAGQRSTRTSQAREWWQEAEDALEEALAVSRDIGNPYAEAQVLYVYGLLRIGQGEHRLAHERLVAALAILNRLGDRLYAEHVERALAEIGH
jgi:hypothetical protein